MMENLKKPLDLKPIFAGIQKFTTLDDEGEISVVLFTRGCNLRCHYCHNPELVVPPFSSFLDVDYIINFLDKRKNILSSVVITGGEPTLWGDDLIDWIRYIKSLGYRVKFDTNGFQPVILHQLIEEQLVDKVAIDFKAPFEKYESITGVSCNIYSLKKSLQLLLTSDLEYEIRSTIHSDLHSQEDVESMILELVDLGIQNYYLQAYKQPNKTVGDVSSQSYFNYLHFENLLSNFFENYGIRNI